VEVWSWWREGSIHRSRWPESGTLRGAAAGRAEPAVLAVAGDVIGAVRKAKSEAKRSMRTAVTRATVTDTAERLAWLALVEADVRAAGHIAELPTQVGAPFGVEVELAPPDG
jgi:valyl-tRNA synthetase